MRYSFTLIFMLCLVACQQTHYTKVTYKHSDGTISPAYYRRYHLHVEKDSLQFRVSNYAEQLHDTTFVLSKKEEKKLHKLIEEHKLGSLKYNKQIVGAPTDQLNVYSKEGLEVSYQWNRGHSASVAAIVDYMHTLVPNLDKHINYSPFQKDKSKKPVQVDTEK